MIHNAFTGEPIIRAESLAQQETDFTAGGATAPGDDAPNDGPRAATAEAPNALLRMPTATPVPDISLDDWDALLSAVKSRLRLTGESLTQFNGAAAPMQASVLECVDALDQLHFTLNQTLAAAQPTRIVVPAPQSD